MSTQTNSKPRNAIKPFVPVGPEDSTEIYSHTELRALSTTDARNELDELSEPDRFLKGVTRSNVYPDPGPRSRRSPNRALIFLVGAASGAILIALTTPRTGSKLRRDIKEFLG